MRNGAGGPINDIYSVGRIGEAMLRGGAPLGPWGAGGGSSGGAPGPLWDFIQRCQSPSIAERPSDAVEALAQLERMGLSQAPALTLPLSGFVRGHVRALRELRRWRAQPLPPLGSHQESRSYRERSLVEPGIALVGAIGVAACCSGRRPSRWLSRRGIEARPRMASLGYLSVRSAPAGARAGCDGSGRAGGDRARSQPRARPSRSMGVCCGESRESPCRWPVTRGAHELRATEGSLSTAQSLELRQGQKVVLECREDTFERTVGRRRRSGASPAAGGTPGPRHRFVRPHRDRHARSPQPRGSRRRPSCAWHFGKLWGELDLRSSDEPGLDARWPARGAPKARCRGDGVCSGPGDRHRQGAGE